VHLILQYTAHLISASGPGLVGADAAGSVRPTDIVTGFRPAMTMAGEAMS